MPQDGNLNEVTLAMGKSTGTWLRYVSDVAVVMRREMPEDPAGAF
jgi:hypothetical protein